MRGTLGVKGNSVRSAVKSHIQGRRGGCNGVNRAAAGACRKLNYVGLTLGIKANSFSLGLALASYKFIRHIFFSLEQHV